MIVYYLSYNHGDGPVGCHFFRNEPDISALIEEDENYCMNEEVESFEIPDGPNTIDFQD